MDISVYIYSSIETKISFLICCILKSQVQDRIKCPLEKSKYRRDRFDDIKSLMIKKNIGFRTKITKISTDAEPYYSDFSRKEMARRSEEATHGNEKNI